MAKIIRLHTLKHQSQISIFVSILLFIFSLLFPGVYTHSGHIERAYFDIGLALLLLGWVSVFLGHFFWIANPLFFISLIISNSKPKLAAKLSLFALLFALSLVFYGEVVGVEGGGDSGTWEITTYGHGYFLWVMSIFTLFSSQLIEHWRQNTARASKVYLLVLAQYFLIVVSTGIFVIHFYIGDSSYFQTVQERKAFFEKNCHKAKEEIFIAAKDVSGVYFGPDIPFYDYDNFMRDRYLLFYETNTDNDGGSPYLRFPEGNKTGIAVDTLESEYSVVAKDITKNLRQELGIRGVELSVIENSTNKIIATKIYLASYGEGGETCGSRDYATFLHKVFGGSKNE